MFIFLLIMGLLFLCCVLQLVFAIRMYTQHKRFQEKIIRFLTAPDDPSWY